MLMTAAASGGAIAITLASPSLWSERGKESGVQVTLVPSPSPSLSLSFSSFSGDSVCVWLIDRLACGGVESGGDASEAAGCSSLDAVAKRP